jgi:hypothetical protein
MKKIIVIIGLAFCTLMSSAQQQDKRLNFILFIDNELPLIGITDGLILFKDDQGFIKDSLPFSYHVGALAMSSTNYEKLFASNLNYRILIKFNYKLFRPKYQVFNYEGEIPPGWLNEEYIIFKVYNSSNKTSKAKYLFQNGNKYIVQVIIPSKSTTLNKR